MSDSPLAQLRAAAESVRQQLQLSAYDAAAVQQLAKIIEAQRRGITPATRQGIIISLGAFLGQCLVESFQGQWAAGPDGTTGVGIRGQLFFNPFYRVAQQLEHGVAASVADFYAALAGRLAQS